MVTNVFKSDILYIPHTFLGVDIPVVFPRDWGFLTKDQRNLLLPLVSNSIIINYIELFYQNYKHLSLKTNRRPFWWTLYLQERAALTKLKVSSYAQN